MVHPGLATAETPDRDRMAEGLSQLLEALARTELARMLVVQVRTVPDDGAERTQWVAAHRRRDAPALSQRVNEQVAAMLTAASVRTEAFVTVVVAEAVLAKPGRHAGGGLDGRARALYGLLTEVETHLLGPGRRHQRAVAGLTSAVRGGAHRVRPRRAGHAGAGGRRRHHPPGHLRRRVPWALAGPTRAGTPIRWYDHDAWRSVSATVLLPDRGAVLGALAPILVPASPGERRCYTVFFPVVSDRKAARSSASAEVSAATGSALRRRLGQQVRARQRRTEAQTHAVDAKLSHGRAMVRPAAVASVTVPAWWPIDEHGRDFEASIRRAGYTPQRLDLAADSGFIASAIPLGVGLRMSRSSR